MQKQENYCPTHPEFFKEESFAMPLVLELGNTEEEIRDNLVKNYTFTQPEGKKTFNRHYDYAEIEQFRSEYIDVLENKIKVAEENLEEVKAKAKQMTAEATATLKSAETQIKDLVWKVKHGKAEVIVPGEDLYTIAAHGYYHKYWLRNQSLIMCNVEIIKEIDQQKLFDVQKRNEAEKPLNETHSEAV